MATVWGVPNFRIFTGNPYFHQSKHSKLPLKHHCYLVSILNRLQFITAELLKCFFLLSCKSTFNFRSNCYVIFIRRLIFKSGKTPFKELPGDIFNNPTTLSSQIKCNVLQSVKIKRQRGKQCRSRWGGSKWATSFESMLFASTSLNSQYDISLGGKILAFFVLFFSNVNFVVYFWCCNGLIHVL